MLFIQLAAAPTGKCSPRLTSDGGEENPGFHGARRLTARLVLGFAFIRLSRTDRRTLHAKCLKNRVNWHLISFGAGFKGLARSFTRVAALEAKFQSFD
jgi:hypothetical protein